MCTIVRTCDIVLFWSAPQWGLFIKKCSYFVHMKPFPARKLLRVFRNWAFCLFSFPPFRWSGVEVGGSVCTWFFCPGGLPPLPLDLGPARGVECFWTIVCCARARSRFANSFGSWRRVSCSFAAVFFLCLLHSSVDFHHSSPHVRRRGEFWKTSEDRYRVLSSRGFRSSDRGACVDKRALRERGRSSDRYRSRRVRSQLRGDRYRFSDRYRSCRGRSRCVWSRSFDCYQSHRSACVFPARRGGRSDH